MTLIELEAIEPLLACPRCGAGLVREEGSFHCSSPRCTLYAADSLPVAGRWPVLIDASNSIVGSRPSACAAAATPAHRWSIARLPRALAWLWKPHNIVAARNVGALLAQLTAPRPIILVIGGATVGNGTQAIYDDRRPRVIAFDLYGSPVTQFIADAHAIPLAGASVDAVIVQAVLEHVLDPARVVREIHRVLKPDGLVYAETPFLQPVHAGAHDFTRYTSSGHRYLFRSFDEIAGGPVAGPAAQLLASIDFLVRGLLRSELAGKLARGALFWLRWLDRAIPEAYAMDSASAYYFLGRRCERELSPREIVDYYRGAQRSAVDRC